MGYRRATEKGTRVVFAALFSRLVLAGVLASPLAGMSELALAQGAFPWAKFIELVQRKGDDVTQEGPCTHLGLNRNCRAYQVAQQEDEWTHTFNVVMVRDVRTGHLILYKRSDAGAGSFYLTDLKGKLMRAVSRSEGASEQASWSKLDIGSGEVRRGFAQELAYWRANQGEVANAPDRKE